MMRRRPGDEIWLQGNVRPVLGLVAVAGCALAACAGLLTVVGAGAWWWGVAGVAAAAIAVPAVALGYAASQPRLVRRGDRLRVRLTPLATEELPLEVVECVFPGSQPLGEPPEAGSAARRVGTMIVRVAERATAWRERPTVAAWGSWRDGSIAFDGRWCEPLSPEKIRAIAARLLEAKREQTAAGTPPGAGTP